MILFFDTETTGLPQNGLPNNHQNQPHIVQIAAILTDEAGKEMASINLIVKPDDCLIPEQVSRIHGITDEVANKYGVSEMLALSAFYHLGSKAEIFVAHNIGFDMKLIDIAGDRKGKLFTWKKKFCTMEAMRDICAIPATEKMIAAGFTANKSPKLIEAYTKAFDKGFDGAHNALADVRACKEIYFWLKNRPSAST